jgi:hypothetical protein
MASSVKTFKGSCRGVGSARDGGPRQEDCEYVYKAYLSRPVSDKAWVGAVAILTCSGRLLVVNDEEARTPTSHERTKTAPPF